MTQMDTIATAGFQLLSKLRQHNRLLRLNFPNEDGPEALMLANRLDASEGLSRDFRFVVEVVSNDADIALKDVQGKMVTVELVREDGSIRYFNGYVFEFQRDGSDGALVFYRMVLAPWLAYLRLRRDNYLFHDKTVREQTEEIFADYQVATAELRINGDDPAITFACQYDESDYNYLHRRWEQLGWHYRYEHNADGHTLILSDDSVQSPVIEGARPDIPFQGEAGSMEDDGLQKWMAVRRLVPASVALSSYDFKKPRPAVVDVPSINEQGDVLRIETYAYAGAYGFKNNDDGESQARIRSEEIEASGKYFEGYGNDRTAQPGRRFTLSGHFDGGAGEDLDFLIVDAHHTASNNLQDGSDAASHYANRITCSRNKVPWRPGRGFNSTETKVYGLQTAIVVGPSGEEIFTDEYGRVRVQFHWDRAGQSDDRSSTWIRVATAWAGANFGMTSIPRIGSEVIVQFLDGNPDRPIITGMVPNADTMPPWPLPANKTQSGILSRSTPGGAYENANAIRFEDKKGAEQLWLHAEKDQLTEVEHDEDKWVGNDRRKTIDRDENSHIKRDRTEQVGQNEKITIGANRTENVGGNETISIGKNRTEDVGAEENVSIGGSRHVVIGKVKTETVALAKMLTIGGAYQTSVGGAMNTTVALMQAEEVGLSKTVMVGQKISFTAGDEFRIEVGDSTFVMRKDGRIEISGKEIILRGSKKVEVHGDDVDINPQG
ncbi:type VI secretion system tip protein TssI/VgrG [Massilia sp. METH4]|uniref:type VI secretion system Vgr family protein n=1 Tax=Massilia sp. METH4 TaxID=3123041 RepID=UPI0030D5DB7C